MSIRHERHRLANQLTATGRHVILGGGAGARVFAGQIRRGDTITVDAAI